MSEPNEKLELLETITDDNGKVLALAVAIKMSLVVGEYQRALDFANELLDHVTQVAEREKKR